MIVYNIRQINSNHLNYQHDYPFVRWIFILSLSVLSLSLTLRLTHHQICPFLLLGQPVNHKNHFLLTFPAPTALDNALNATKTKIDDCFDESKPAGRIWGTYYPNANKTTKIWVEKHAFREIQFMFYAVYRLQVGKKDRKLQCFPDV